MIYPILAYGDNILRIEAEDCPEGSEDLTKLVEDMYETMYNANGVGLAAPQIGLSHRILWLTQHKWVMSPRKESKERLLIRKFR